MYLEEPFIFVFKQCFIDGCVGGWMDRRYPGDASDRGETPTLPTAKVHPPADQTIQVLGAVPRGNHVDDPCSLVYAPTNSDVELVD